MKVSIKYREVMEELFGKELEWLREEFEILFKSKTEGYTENDKKIANDILGYILENNYAYFNIIYNDGSNFAKLQRVLISIDDNLNFLINFMSAR